MLLEWKTEFSKLSPASSLQGGSSSSFSSDICRLLQLCEKEDDATGALADGAVPKPELDVQGHQIGVSVLFQERYSEGLQEHGFQLVGQCRISPLDARDVGVHNLERATQLDYRQFDLLQDFEQNSFYGSDGYGCCDEALHQASCREDLGDAGTCNP